MLPTIFIGGSSVVHTIGIPGLRELTVQMPNNDKKRISAPIPCGFHTLDKIPIGKVVLTATTDATLLPIHVDGAKNVMRKPREELLPDAYSAKTVIQIQARVGKNETFAAYPNNNFRILSATRREITIWEIAVVSQHGTFFITCQETLKVALKPGLQNILYGEGPRLGQWPQMRQLLEEILCARILALPEGSPEQHPVNTVMWYNFAQGLGAIRTKNGTARVHWSNIVPRQQDGFRYLIPGERVGYVLHPIVPGNGERQTTFTLEAKNVVGRQ